MLLLRRTLLMLILATAALAVACAGDAEASPGTPTDDTSTATPAPTRTPVEGTPAASSPDAATPDGTGAGTAAPAGRTVVTAPIDGVELVTRESVPPQYAVIITSGLPSGCAEYHEALLERAGTEITITVTNTMPAGTVPCTMIYGYTQHTVELGSDFASGTEYTVRVNDRALTFVAQ